MDDSETLVPARDEFVLRAEASDDAVTRARSLGAVECLDSTPPLCRLVVPAQPSAKESWQHAVVAVGRDVPLFPVLYDKTGAAHFPTGEVTIRFRLAPTDGELRDFCRTHRLRLLRRNAFVDRQVVCEPIDAAERFLPELVAVLAALPGVHNAWANTLSRYRRADQRAG